MANNAFANLITALNADDTRTYPESRQFLAGLANMGQVYIGSVTGTTALLDVPTPGNPRAVVVINGNSGTTGIKLEDMATNTAMKLNSTGPAVSVAADMITLGTDKFTIGVDAQLNTAHTLHFIAVI